MTQKDVVNYGFSARHYQELEAGQPHTLTMLFRIGEMFGIDPSALIKNATEKMKY